MKTIRVLSTGIVAPKAEPVEVALPLESNLGAVRALSCGERPGADVISAGRLRRLGRTQRLVVAAAREACAGQRIDEAECGPISVAVGSGAGEQNETVEFLRNVFERAEAEPKPARFVNSVPSSLSAQVAMELGLHGENLTCIHRAVSFELALWHAATFMKLGRTKCALAVGGDALESDLLAVGMQSSWWRNGALPGEGAGGLLLGVDDARMSAPRLAFVHVRPLPRSVRALDMDAEVELLLAQMKMHDVAADSGTLLLLGGNGSGRGEIAGGAFLTALRARLGDACPAAATYTQRTGEFCSASALGAVYAARAVECGHVVDEMQLIEGRAPSEIRAVVCHAFSEPGHRAIMAFAR